MDRLLLNKDIEISPLTFPEQNLRFGTRHATSGEPRIWWSFTLGFELDIIRCYDMREQCLDFIGGKKSTRTTGRIESVNMVSRPRMLELFTKRASGDLCIKSGREYPFSSCSTYQIQDTQDL